MKVATAEAAALLSDLQTTALVNRTLGTHLTPWELAAWPMEHIDLALIWATYKAE